MFPLSYSEMDKIYQILGDGPFPEIAACVDCGCGRTGVPHLYENAPPQDPTVGLFLVSWGVGRFLMGKVPL